eukprot:5064682-Amphidinium_carterae.1
MLRQIALAGKGQGMVASCNILAGQPLLIELPLLCVAQPGLAGICSVCLGDTSGEACSNCGDSTCEACGPHECMRPTIDERELRDSMWLRLFEKYVLYRVRVWRGQEPAVDWASFARVPSSVYAGWHLFAKAAHLFTSCAQRWLRNECVPEEIVEEVASASSFLDFYLLARANTTKIATRGSGIFLQHARLNHACHPNAFAQRLGDLVAVDHGSSVDRSERKTRPAEICVIASQDIDAGTEVCINYFQSEAAHESARPCESFMAVYGVECLCLACVTDRPVSCNGCVTGICSCESH